jgi:hypothetical protein
MLNKHAKRNFFIIQTPLYRNFQADPSLRTLCYGGQAVVSLIEPYKLYKIKNSKVNNFTHRSSRVDSAGICIEGQIAPKEDAPSKIGASLFIKTTKKQKLI